MHKWTNEQFLEQVYNDRYIDVDPDYVSERPTNNAKFLLNLFSDASDIRHLDYGGGNSCLSNYLKRHSWHSTSFDPFPKKERCVEGLGKYNLITAFEVFEHAPCVLDLVNNLSVLMEDSCLIVFSTLISDGHLKPDSRINWWYASPRNGHISLFSRRSLEIIAERQKWTFASSNDGLHIFFNNLPLWAKRVIK
jgi:hypothetical protein